MDVMLAVMRDPHVALDMRVKMALKALPHLHRKLRAGELASVAGINLCLPGVEKIYPRVRGASMSRRSDTQSMKPPRRRVMALHQSKEKNRVASSRQPEH